MAPNPHSTEAVSDPSIVDAVSGRSYSATKLAPEDAWIGKFDYEAFKADIQALGKQLSKGQGPEDMAHLRKIIWWSRACQWIGVLTMWHSVNLISIFFLSLGCMTRWTIVGHHVCHGGFDKVDDTGGRFNRFKFGVGSLMRRSIDWLDWMLVEAWNTEHNMLHHYHLGEESDPDLVERNLAYLRGLEAPMAVKYIGVVWMVTTWKWWYYAPNTYKELKIRQAKRNGIDLTKNGEKDAQAPLTVDPTWITHGVPGKFFEAADFFIRVLGPFFVQRFCLLPLPVYFLLGYGAWKIALINLLLSEICTNTHSFIVIATNHAGDDLYRFDTHCKPRSATFYLRQVISSVDFSYGNDVTDFMHGWLNYQIEHHLWPDLSMLSYQRSAPMVRAICEKHGVPYLKHNVFWRFKKTVDIMTNQASMRRFPTAWDHAPDYADVE